MRKKPTLIPWLAIAVCVMSGPALAQLGPAPFAAFPSEDETDGRMLGFGCPGIQTFESGVSITLSAASTEADFTISIFDGETTGKAATGHWDVGTRQLLYRLYYDPFLQGNTDPADLVGTWTGNDPNPLANPDPDPDKAWTVSSTAMPDNDWWAVEVVTAAAAQSAPGSPYSYHLRIDLDGACTSGEQVESNIKIAASSPLNFQVPRFGFVAALRQISNDRPIIYPGSLPPPNPPPAGGFILAPTTFDGTFEFFINLPMDSTELSVFDGDYDHGIDQGGGFGLPSGVPIPTCVDLDDPNTPADYADFPAALGTAGTDPEGAIALGAPPDDNTLDVFRRGEPGSPTRVGCVRYELIDPNGNVYRNDNPSSNREWERFRLVGQADPSAGDPSAYDVLVPTPTLPGGVWTVRLFGLDMSNLNFWFTEAAQVCALRPRPGALPTIRFDQGADGQALAAGTIVAEQFAAFGVHVTSGDPVNHPPMIFDSASPTGGDPDLGTPNETCVLPGPGIGSGGEVGTAGENCLPQGKVLILSEDGDATDPDDDGGGGTFIFTFDDPVMVDAVELLDIEESGGSISAYDAGGNLVAAVKIPAPGDNSFQRVDVGAIGASRLEITLVSSGAVASIIFADEPMEPACPPPSYLVGDTVWFDANLNGVQDPGEAGIPGVLVNLFDEPGGRLVNTFVTGDSTQPGFDLCAAANTGLDEDGLYCFRVPARAYTVVIDPSNFAPGGALADLVSTTGGEQQTDTVFDANVLTYDFGYAPASLGDRVWRDSDGDGVQDLGEAGINGVTVELLDAGGMVIATTVTAGDGNYLFSDLAPGTYTVRVDPTTLPFGVVQTFDLDGLGTLNEATGTLAAQQIRLDFDFGYQDCGECDDKVSELTLRYNGSVPVQVVVEQDNGEVVFSTLPGGGFEFDCSKPIDALTMIWNGTQSVRIKAWKGDVGSTLLADQDNIAVGDEVTVTGFAGSPNDVFWEVFAAGTSTKLGESKFHLSCSDDDMDGAEDCGNAAGNGKDSGSSLLNDWIFEGMVDSDETLDCSDLSDPSTALQPGEVFSFFGTDDGTFGNEIEIFVNGVSHTKIHTSCSKPIGPNLTSGDFTIVAGASDQGGPLCPLEACAPSPLPTLEFHDKEVRWEVTNLGDLPLVISRIELTWPFANGYLDEVKRDGDAIFKEDRPAPMTVIDSGWEGNEDKRTIKAGDNDTLKFKFENDAVASETTFIRVEFGPDCAIEIEEDGTGSSAPFDCSKPIDALTMIWNGTQSVRIKAWKGDVGSTLLADQDNIAVGDEVTVTGFAGSPNDVVWEVFAAGTSTKLGESEFHLSCSDDEMDGSEDCGLPQGNGKGNDSGLLNDWIFEGMVDSDEILDCTP